MTVKRIYTFVEETLVDAGEPVAPAARVAVVAAVIDNPWAGQGYVRDLQPGIVRTAPDLGRLLAERVVAALDAPVEAYGKGAIVGINGELEQGSGLIHTLMFGNSLRDLTGATTLLPAVEKRAAPGTSFDIPMKHILDATMRSHHQSIEVRIPAAPAPDEIVIALAAAAQGRPHQRLAAFSPTEA